jgi:phage protein D
LQNELIEERKKRRELEDKIRDKISGNANEASFPEPEERKRPKNAYMLFVADQKEKIMRDHPNIEQSKVVALAAIKWRKISEEQKKIYEKRLQEMNKYFDEYALYQKQKQATQAQIENNLVKREDDGNQREADKIEEEEGKNREVEPVVQNQEMAGTVVIEN